MSVNSVSGMNSGYISLSSLGYVDSEYERICQQLRALGIEPTGNKSADKDKLMQVKQSRAAKSNAFVQTADAEKQSQSEVSTQSNNTEISAAAGSMTGASQVAQMNKFKLLGLY